MSHGTFAGAREFFARAREFFARAREFFARAREFFARAREFFARAREFFARAREFFVQRWRYFVQRWRYFVQRRRFFVAATHPQPLWPLDQALDAGMRGGRSTLYEAMNYMRDGLAAPLVHEGDAQQQVWRYAKTGYQLPTMWLSANELLTMLLAQQLWQHIKHDKASSGMLAPALGPLEPRVRKNMGDKMDPLECLHVRGVRRSGAGKLASANQGATSESGRVVRE